MQIQSMLDSKLQPKMKTLIGGPSGAGKTRLASTLGGKTLLIDLENGALSCRGFDVDVWPAYSGDKIQNLREVFAFLKTPEAMLKYNHVYVDSGTEMSQNILESLLIQYPSRSDSLVLYNETAKLSKTIFKSLRNLDHYNVFITFLVDDAADEIGRRYKKLSVIGKLSQTLPAYFDECFYLENIEDDDGSIKRRLVTQSSDKYVVKDRSARLDQYEPADLGYILNKINGKI